MSYRQRSRLELCPEDRDQIQSLESLGYLCRGHDDSGVASFLLAAMALGGNEEMTTQGLQCDNRALGGCRGPVEYCWAAGAAYCIGHHEQAHGGRKSAVISCRNMVLRNLARGRRK